MTDEPNNPAPIQADREAAWALKPSCYKEADKARWMGGSYDHLQTIQAFMRHRLAHTPPTRPETPLENNKWIEEARGTLDHLNSALQRLNVPHRVDWREWIDQMVLKFSDQPEAGDPVAETAWLIERHDLATIDSRNEVCLHYYAEWPTGKHYWTPDHTKAKRFPDEAAARLETNGDPLLSVVEHMWCSLPACPIAEAGDGEKMREIFSLIHGLIQEAKGGAGDVAYVTNHLDDAENWLDKIEEALSTTPPAPADLVRMSAEAYIRDWCPDHVKDYIAFFHHPSQLDRDEIAAHLGQAFLVYSYDERWNIAGVILALLHPAQE